MTNTPGTPSFTARESRLTPDSVADRRFTEVKRGYAEAEVRAYLRMIADELSAILARERDYAARIQELEERLAQPPHPPSEQDLIAALGQETANVLSQAREAANDLRTRAEEHARRVVREAQETARELRTSTQQTVEAKTREAEEAARARAREIIGEARALRERVLTDLNERRGDLERQVAELRASRSKLVDVYQLVERTLAQATRTMMEEPPMAAPTAESATPAAETLSTPDTSADTQHEAAAPSATVDVDTNTARAATTERDSAATRERTSEPSGDSDDVGALFARLRSGTAVEALQEGSAAETGPEPGDAGSVTASDSNARTGAPEAAAGMVDDRPAEGGADRADGGASADAAPALDERAPDDAADADRSRLAERDDTLAPIAEDLGRRAKRALQDEQNDVLDGLRRQRGKIDATKVLPPRDEQLSRWAHVLQPSVDKAYAAGLASVSRVARGDGDGASAPGALLSELAASVVTPLRNRLESSLAGVDARTPADAEIAIAQRLGARYREWRGQDLDSALGDAVAAAYTRGVFEAAPKGAQLRWIAARVGKCPDCDDNALEPTARGDAFPTGQKYPPAHPGCRCTLVVV